MPNGYLYNKNQSIHHGKAKHYDLTDDEKLLNKDHYHLQGVDGDSNSREIHNEHSALLKSKKIREIFSLSNAEKRLVSKNFHPKLNCNQSEDESDHDIPISLLKLFDSRYKIPPPSVSSRKSAPSNPMKKETHAAKQPSVHQVSPPSHKLSDLDFDKINYSSLVHSDSSKNSIQTCMTNEQQREMILLKIKQSLSRKP